MQSIKHSKILELNMAAPSTQRSKVAPKLPLTQKRLKHLPQDGFTTMNFRRKINDKSELRLKKPSFSRSVLASSGGKAKREFNELIIEYLLSLNERTNYFRHEDSPKVIPNTFGLRTKKAEKNSLTGFVVLRAYVSKFIQSRAEQAVISRDVKQIWDSLPQFEKDEWNRIAEVYRFQNKTPDINSSFHAWLEEHLAHTTPNFGGSPSQNIYSLS